MQNIPNKTGGITTMVIIETHRVDQSETFIRLYNEGKTIKEIRKKLGIGFTAYRTYLRDNKQHLQNPTKTCPICGKTFTKKTNSHTYCTPGCKEKARRPRKQNYHREYYNKNRDKILARRRELYHQNKKGGHP